MKAGGFAKTEVTVFEAHQCTQEEITKEVYDQGLMYICPPMEKVHVYNNYNYVPYTVGGFRIYPNYNEKDKNSDIDNFVDDFILSRM